MIMSIIIVLGAVIGAILVVPIADLLDSSKFINSIREYLEKLGKKSKSSFPEFFEFLLTSEALTSYILLIYGYILIRLGILDWLGIPRF